MTTKQFVEKAIEGGWRKDENPDSSLNADGVWVQFFAGGDTGVSHFSEIILDPLAWQAVGKVEGWDVVMKGFSCPCHEEIYYTHKFCQDCGKALNPVERWTTNWAKSMHRMIDDLCEGKSIEQFLETL